MGDQQHDDRDQEEGHDSFSDRWNYAYLGPTSRAVDRAVDRSDELPFPMYPWRSRRSQPFGAPFHARRCFGSPFRS